MRTAELWWVSRSFIQEFVLSMSMYKLNLGVTQAFELLGQDTFTWEKIPFHAPFYGVSSAGQSGRGCRDAFNS